ncbi:MAG: hypothetical protein ACI9XK_004114 [Granulosicoccus sp.]|jgi:hypothetical protein
MTIQDWGAIAEVVGSVAIIVTLIYLAIQIKFAKLSTIDQNRDRRVTALREIHGRFALNPELRRAHDQSAGEDWKSMLQTLASTWGLSTDEASAVLFSQIDFIWTHWSQYRSMKSTADEKELRNIITVYYASTPMTDIIRHPTLRALFDSEFIDWVDTILNVREKA